MKQIEINDKEVFKKYLDSSIINSEYQFSTLLVWSERYKFSYEEINNTLYIWGKQSDGSTQCYFPLGQNSLEERIEHIIKVFDDLNEPINIRPLSKEMLTILTPYIKGNFTIGSKDSYTDYIYDYSMLLSFNDIGYKQKRKDTKYFYNNYKSTYMTLEKENIENAICGLYEILKSSSLEIDKDEWNAYLRLFENFEKLDLRGGIIYINGKVAAISIGEVYFDNIMIHMRRCDKRFRGIYPAMLQQLLRNEFTDREYKYINLQDDMGLLNIRKAKLSYRPVMLLKKYFIKGC